MKISSLFAVRKARMYIQHALNVDELRIRERVQCSGTVAILSARKVTTSRSDLIAQSARFPFVTPVTKVTVIMSRPSSFSRRALKKERLAGERRGEKRGE